MAMSKEKILSILDRYDEELRELGLEPQRHVDLRPDFYHKPDPVDEHLLHCIGDLRQLLEDDTRREKAMRWLGFIQGALWARGWYSVNDLMDHNKPDETE